MIRCFRFPGVRRAPWPSVVVGIAVAVVIVTLALVRLVRDRKSRGFAGGVVDSQVALDEKRTVDNGKKDGEQHGEDECELNQALPDQPLPDLLLLQ